MATALGIDVGGIRKGLDLVLLDESRRVLKTARGVSTSSLSDVIRDWLPGCIAIDSPPKWASERERLTETEMRRIGLQFYQTPWLPENQAKDFYLWMKHGFQVFEVAHHCGFPLFDGGESVQGKVFEVFPAAIAAVLAGGNRPREIPKETWRRRVLGAQDVEFLQLKGSDQVDAALAALTGIIALEGGFCWNGAPEEGVMVLPCAREALLSHYFMAQSPGTPTLGSQVHRGLHTHGLTHIALHVSDLDRALRFYQTLLGAVVLHRDAAKVEIGTPGARDVISLELGLVASRDTGSIAHFGFRLVSPVTPDAIAAEVERAGGVVEKRGEFTPCEGYVFARDPDGYLFEIWYEAESAARS